MIGIFDSGSGGLTVLQAIRAQAPQADILYLGDIANMPYGQRDAKDLERLTFAMMRLLRTRGATTLVSACNSISASVIRPMFELLGIRDAGVIEMVGPAMRAVVGRAFRRIVVLATPATAASGLYQRGGEEAGLDVQVVTSPTLAALVERGEEGEALQSEIERLVKATVVLLPDAVILGCTHYPFVRERLEESLARQGCRASVLDPAPAVALEAVMHHGIRGTGKIEILITAESAPFRSRVAGFCGLPEATIQLIEAF